MNIVDLDSLTAAVTSDEPQVLTSGTPVALTIRRTTSSSSLPTWAIAVIAVVVIVVVVVVVAVVVRESSKV